MGLITEEVEVRVCPKYIKRLEKLGYDIPKRKREGNSIFPKYAKGDAYDTSKYITIRVTDLTERSKVNVLCECDYCGDLFECTYEMYNYNVNGVNPKVCCKKCSQTKRMETNMMIYGQKNAPLTEEGIQAMKEKCLNKYGTEWYLQSDDCKNKSKETNLKKRGVKFPSQSPEVREKINNSVKQKYGVDHIGQLDWVMEKKKQTMYEHFGTRDYLTSEECKEKMRKNNLQKYGVEYTLQVEEFREKGRQTMFNNQSAPTSIQQEYLCNLFGGDLNYPIRYYSGDIVLLNDKIDIEYSGGGHWLSIIYASETEESFKHREIVRYMVIKKEGYKQIEIISRKDYLPSDEILLQMLSDAKQYFSDYPEHSWITFDIDNNIVKNAEYKDGRSYFYGKLRKIKKDDLKSA